MEVKPYKIWRLAGDYMEVVQRITCWRARAIEQADFYTKRTGQTHVAVVVGSAEDRELIAEKQRKQRGRTT